MTNRFVVHKFAGWQTGTKYTERLQWRTNAIHQSILLTKKNSLSYRVKVELNDLMIVILTLQVSPWHKITAFKQLRHLNPSSLDFISLPRCVCQTCVGRGYMKGSSAHRHSALCYLVIGNEQNKIFWTIRVATWIHKFFTHWSTISLLKIKIILYYMQIQSAQPIPSTFFVVHI